MKPTFRPWMALSETIDVGLEWGDLEWKDLARLVLRFGRSLSPGGFPNQRTSERKVTLTF